MAFGTNLGSFDASAYGDALRGSGKRQRNDDGMVSADQTAAMTGDQQQPFPAPTAGQGAPQYVQQIGTPGYWQPGAPQTPLPQLQQQNQTPPTPPPSLVSPGATNTVPPPMDAAQAFARIGRGSEPTPLSYQQPQVGGYGATGVGGQPISPNALMNTLQTKPWAGGSLEGAPWAYQQPGVPQGTPQAGAQGYTNVPQGTQLQAGTGGGLVDPNGNTWQQGQSAWQAPPPPQQPQQSTAVVGATGQKLYPVYGPNGSYYSLTPGGAPYDPNAQPRQSQPQNLAGSLQQPPPGWQGFGTPTPPAQPISGGSSVAPGTGAIGQSPLYGIQSGQDPYQVAQVGSRPTPDAYAQALQASMAPMFDKQRQSLAASQAARGIMTSGAGNQGMQELTGQQDAILAGGLMPLIQQGYAQNFQGDMANADRLNAARAQQTGILGGYGAQMLGGNIQAGLQRQAGDIGMESLLQNQSFQGQLANQAADMQAGNYNATGYNNVLGQNVGTQNQFQNNQMGYGHQDYANALAQLYGLTGNGLASGAGILGAGMGNIFNGQQNVRNQMLPYANQAGYNTGYGTPRGYGGGSGPTMNMPIDPATGRPYIGVDPNQTPANYNPNAVGNNGGDPYTYPNTYIPPVPNSWTGDTHEQYNLPPPPPDPVP